MNQTTDFASDKLVEAFTRQLEVLGRQHRQTCAVLGAVRLMHDLDELNRPPQRKLSPLTRATRWLLHSLVAVTTGAPHTSVQARSWPVMVDSFADLPDVGEAAYEDDVIVIDAEYRVIHPGKEQ